VVQILGSELRSNRTQKMRYLAIFFVTAYLHSTINGFVSFASKGVSRKAFKPSLLHLSPVEDISLGAPYDKPVNGAYVSEGGVKVDVQVEDVLDPTQAISDMVDIIDNHKGGYKFCVILRVITVTYGEPVAQYCKSAEIICIRSSTLMKASCCNVCPSVSFHSTLLARNINLIDT
jgi:hypothetical protein